ncbi:DNA polymerase III, delta subunit [Syntrophotalea carbinolica DSM 2380]|uniref:DNA polymerase III subunit delta n=1 Tax=Syntrophotalea carbinolica (strain DSM 2380 / NBRC 103641 / GraBd1) TaxID=338963 RepID=Q3A4P6_SYNC1|nr:DNA polymerase III subunit delta [Syntrophotalea carbinolica]ABA88661.1 DNA polymerase III, delta subunit [Syntrophotalea carbinolica DSM 2380]
MTPGELKKRIRDKTLPALLFLYGEETFFVERSLRQIIDATIPVEARDFNLQIFHGKDSRAVSILDTARTLPVFSPIRLVVVRDTQDVPAAELEQIIPYLSDAVPETILVFTGNKIDGRRKFYQVFKKFGALVEFKKLYDNQIPSFVTDQSQDLGFDFTEEALALFCKRVGSHLQEIHGELSKLLNFLGGRRVAEVADVMTVVSDSRVDSVFDLSDALGKRDVGEALRLLHRLLAEGIAPLLILAMITRHFRQLWKAHELLQQRVAEKDMARRIGINPYFVSGLVAQARRFPGHGFRGIFEALLETDLALKSTGSSPSVVLESLVLRLAAK